MSVRRRLTRAIRARDGVSLVELLVAMLVLSVGILGMAAGTGWMIRTVDLSRLETERAAALQAAVEQVRGTPYADAGTGERSEGSFDISWSTAQQTQNGKQFEFVIVGLGRERGSIGPRATITDTAADTLYYWISRP